MIRRMHRLVLLLIGIVLVGIAGFALVWFGEGRELQPLVAGTLVDLRDGKEAEVLARGDPAFREGRSAEDLAAYWAWWKQEMGTFVEILGRRAVSTSTSTVDGTRVTTKRMTLELGFMKGKVMASFAFRDAEPDPLLTHWRLYLPSSSSFSVADDSVPAALVRTLLTRYDAEDWTGIYVGLSFRGQEASPPRVVRETLRVQRERLGRVITVDALPVDAAGTRGTSANGTGAKKAEADDVLVLHHAIQFERGLGTWTTTLRYDDGRWHVDAFVLR